MDKSYLRLDLVTSHKLTLAQSKIFRRRVGLDKLSLHKKSLTAGLSKHPPDLEVISQTLILQPESAQTHSHMRRPKTTQTAKPMARKDSEVKPTRQLVTASASRVRGGVNSTADFSVFRQAAWTPPYAETHTTFDFTTYDAAMIWNSKSSLQLPKSSLKQLNDSSDSIVRLSQIMKDCDEFTQHNRQLGRNVLRVQRDSKARLKEFTELNQELMFKQSYIDSTVTKFKKEKVAFIFGREGKGRFIDRQLKDPLKAKLFKFRAVD